MNKKVLVFSLLALTVFTAVGVSSADAHGLFRSGGLFSQEEIQTKIAEKVADGTITQEQADNKLARLEERAARHEERQADFAEFLGLSVEELETQIEAGLNPKEIAEAQGISEEALQEWHQAQRVENMTSNSRSTPKTNQSAFLQHIADHTTGILSN